MAQKRKPHDRAVVLEAHNIEYGGDDVRNTTVHRGTTGSIIPTGPRTFQFLPDGFAVTSGLCSVPREKMLIGEQLNDLAYIASIGE